MVAAGKEVDPIAKKFFCSLLGNSETTGCIFTIRNNNVYRISVNQAMEFLRDRLPARFADNIRNKQNFNGHIRLLSFPVLH